MNVFLAILTAVPLIIGCVSGAQRARPTLFFTCLGLLAYFLIFPLINLWDQPYFRSGVILKTQVLCFIWAVFFVGAALFYHSRRARLAVAAAGSTRIQEDSGPQVFSNSVLVGASAAATVIALFASVIFGALHTGSGWARQQSQAFVGMGALATLGTNVLLLPVVVFYLIHLRQRVNTLAIIFAIIVFVLIVPTFAFSGVTGGPLALLMPFGVIWAIKGARFTWPRLFMVCAIGYAGVWFLRLMRLIGEYNRAGAFPVDVKDTLNMYETSVLRPSRSFGEFFRFVQAVAHVDGGGQTMNGDSYFYAFTQFIPGILWAGKSEAMARGRVDVFMRDTVLDGQFGGLIPVGTYGEAYLNFGLKGMLIALLLGWASGFFDARYRTSLLRVPGPLVCALLCPVFIGTCRGAMHYVTGSLLPLLVFVVIAAVLSRLARPDHALQEYPVWQS